MSTGAAPCPQAITQEELFLLPALCRLLAYAVDARRVLGTLTMMAPHVPALNAQLTHACEDWGNPNCDGLLDAALVTLQGYVADRIEVLAASHDI